MNKNAKKIIFAGLIIAALVLIPLSFTHAATTENVLNLAGQSIIKFATWILGTVLFVVGYFFSKLVFLGGVILNWVLELNANIVDNPAVQIGWPITRDIANLGFVFLIILISFSTILRQGSFQIKNTLPKLIVAALLINFSLLIATVFLDIAGVLTNFFLGSAYSASGNGGISQALAGSMSLYSFVKTPDINTDTSLLTFGAGTVQFLASMIFADVMTAIGAITLFGLAFMFLIRYVAIGFLLIMLPAAILGWVAGSGQWKKWTDEFFKYTFFGPIAGFFIYIALKSAIAFEGLASSNLTRAVADDPSQVIKSIGPNIGSMIMIVAILMYGIKKAEEASEHFGKYTTNAAKGAINGILKGSLAGGLGIAARTFTGGRMGSKDIAEWMSKKGEEGKKSQSAIVRGLTRPLRYYGEMATKAEQKYGSVTSLPYSVYEEIESGMGFGSRKFRLKEVAGFEKKKKEKEEEAEEKAKKDVKKIEKIGLIEEEIKKLSEQLEQKSASIRQESLKPNPNPANLAKFQTEVGDITQRIKASRDKIERTKQEETNEDIEKLKKELKGVKEKQESSGEESKKEEKK